MKKRKYILILCFLLIIVIIILSLLFLIKFCKINKIVNLMKSNSEKINNYSYVIDNMYIKRNENIILYGEKSNLNKYYYYDFNYNKVYSFDNLNKKYVINNINKKKKNLLNLPLYKDLTLKYSLLDKLKYVFQWKISDYDNENYEITTKNNYKVILNKTTGFILKSSNIGLNKETIVENFKINCVTEDEVKFPDLSEYKLKENNN